MKLPDVWRPVERPSFTGPMVLDTHIWIWYLDGVRKQMAAEAVEMLRRVVRGEGVLVSDISVWEVGVKTTKAKLELHPSAEAWIEHAGRRPGFSFLPIDREILFRSTRLPGTIHGDPADRMLIAAASLSGVPLATVDPLIIRYASESGGLSVCDCRGAGAGEDVSGLGDLNP